MVTSGAALMATEAAASCSRGLNIVTRVIRAPSRKTTTDPVFYFLPPDFYFPQKPASLKTKNQSKRFDPTRERTFCA
jgi:hypothetical protein